jgi:phospholipid transport system substrate-binding protein
MAGTGRVGELDLLHRISRGILALSLALALSAGFAPVYAQNTAAPAADRASTKPAVLIKGLSDTLQTVMRDAKTLQFAGRRDMLGKQLDDIYHLPVMARIAVGAHWRKLSPAQQTLLVNAFSRLTIATYASRFNDWTGEKFEMRGVQDVRAKTVLVKTAIIRPDKPAVEINYLMRQFEAGWKVIDIFLKESYSELATKRSEYSSILRRQGFDALMTQINEKIAQYERNPK